MSFSQTVMAALVSSGVVTLVYTYLFALERRRYVGVWTVGWFLHTAGLGLMAHRLEGAQSAALATAELLCVLYTGVLFCEGTAEFLALTDRRNWWWAALLVSLWVIGFSLWGSQAAAARVPAFWHLAAVCVRLGVAMLKRLPADAIAARAGARSFVLWGLTHAGAPWLHKVDTLAPLGILVSALLALAVGASLLLTHVGGTRHRLASGEVRDVELYSGPVTADGREYLHVIDHDITARRRAQESLLTTTEIHAILSASPLPIFTLDLDGNVTLWNPAAERVFGWKPEEVLGRRLPIVADKQADDFRALCRRVASGESLSGLERTLYRRDGQPLQISISTAPIRDATGQIAGIMAVVADITRQKELEERCFEARKMEAIGRLAGGIAHHFNNLLTVINGTVELIHRECDADDPLHRDLEQVLSAGTRAADLVRQLLAFGRRQIMNPQPLDLKATLTSMSRMLQQMLGEGVHLQLLPLDGLGTVRADENQIRQVILTLVLNAREAMPEGGIITLGAANVELDDEDVATYPDIKPGSHVALTISDTGPGLTSMSRSQLFEPFPTADGARESVHLGLASVYGIVKQSGGDIQVESAPGQGTTFRIYLPRVYAQAELVLDPDDRPSSGGRETLLVVEAQPDIRLKTARLARSLGHTVFEAEDTPAALHLAREVIDPIELVIIGTMPPEECGADLMRALRAEGLTAKALYISEHPGQDTENASPQDADGVVVQGPITLENLARGIRTALRA